MVPKQEKGRIRIKEMEKRPTAKAKEKMRKEIENL